MECPVGAKAAADMLTLFRPDKVQDALETMACRVSDSGNPLPSLVWLDMDLEQGAERSNGLQQLCEAVGRARGQFVAVSAEQGLF